MLPLSLEEGKPYEFSGMENWAPWLPFTAAPIALPPLSGEQNDTSPSSRHRGPILFFPPSSLFLLIFVQFIFLTKLLVQSTSL
jgi:hypothetical protein